MVRAARSARPETPFRLDEHEPPIPAGGGDSISADGRFVAFESLASNLVLGDNNGFYDRVNMAGDTAGSVHRNDMLPPYRMIPTRVSSLERSPFGSLARIG